MFALQSFYDFQDASPVLQLQGQNAVVYSIADRYNFISVGHS